MSFDKGDSVLLRTIACVLCAIRIAAPCLALALASLLPLPLHASPESEALTQKGLIDLDAGRYRAAIESFNAAVKADATDLRPTFFQAVVLNRLGAHREAYLLLRALEAQGFRHPEIDFEAGWSLMGMRRARACIDRLERFEKATPGRGQTSEFSGRCHLMLGALDKAEAAFRQAVERDPRLASTVDLSMSALEQARGNAAAAQERLKAAAAADAPVGRALREVLRLPSPPRAALRPLRASVSFAVGHNDNVIGLGNTIPLPADISRQDAHFVRVNVGASYTQPLGERTTGTLGSALLLDRYDGLSAANLNDIFLYGDLNHRIDERMGASFRASYEITALGGRRFRNQIGLRPALNYRFTERSITELAFDYASADYRAPTPIVFDRDGDSAAISATHLFQVPNTRFSGALSASVGRNRAHGNDFTYDSRGATASVRYDFTEKISVTLGVGYTRYDYANPNSLTGFVFARDDEQTLVTALLVGPLTEHVRWFVQAHAVDNDSNIAFFDYRQNAISAGVAADF